MTNADLTQIVVTVEDDDTWVGIGNTTLEVLDVSDDYVMAECDVAALSNATFQDFPKQLMLQIHSPDGFGTFLFHEAVVSSASDGKLAIEYICHHPNKYWEGIWGLATLLAAIQGQVLHTSQYALGEIELDDDWKRLTLKTLVTEGPAPVCFNESAQALKRIIREAEIALGGIRWKPEYETNESAFCAEILAPLLRRMGFLSVRYLHGTREYGKDFTFSELTPFGYLRHYGLQAKAGDVSGEVNSAVDELIGQTTDAFSMPYYEIGSGDPRYISSFVVAISGRFTANAKEKIVHKLPKGLVGSVVFLDREAILELIDRHWRTG
jgi:hypothetical protein